METARNSPSPETPNQSYFVRNYNALRRLAGFHLRNESPSISLQATELLHEAFVRLADLKIKWQNRRQFFGVTSETIRRVLVDRARAKICKKRGGENRREYPDLESQPDQHPDELVLEVHDALNQLAAIMPEAAEIARLRFFGGLSMTEAAYVMHISRVTAHRRWQFARAWLAVQLNGESNAIDDPSE